MKVLQRSQDMNAKKVLSDTNIYYPMEAKKMSYFHFLVDINKVREYCD